MNRYSPDKPRLPAGQVLSKKWPVLHYGGVPEVPLHRLRLRVTGAVAQPTWSTYDNDWDGVLFREVAARVKPLPAARHMLMHSFDGYTTNAPLRTLMGQESGRESEDDDDGSTGGVP